MLEEEGFKPERIHTQARVHIEKEGEGFKITTIELRTEAEVPEIKEDTFMDIAEDAKHSCPVSQALEGTEIMLEARLVTSKKA